MPSQRRRKPGTDTPVAKTWDPRLMDDKGLRYEWVKTADINTDPRYQRPLRPAKVDSIVSQFNPDEITAIVVSKRADGTLWMLDGQHRLEALKRLGKQVILADIREGMSLEEEAHLFYRLNEGQTRVSAWDKFRARQTAQEYHAVVITKIVEKNSRFIGPSASGGIQAVGALESAYQMGRLNKTLQVLTAVWALDKTARESNIILGLAQFLLTFDTDDRYDDGQLLASLDAVSPSLIMRRAREIQLETGRSGQRASTVSIAIRDAYNGKMVRGVRPKRQLTGIPIVKWSRTQTGQQPG